MKTRIAFPVVFLALLGLGAGCISMEKTDYHDEARLKVEFENDTAGRLFYETLSKNEHRYARSESNTEISIPIVFEHKHHVVQGESVAFNQAVRRCDTNGDGVITELEAKIFAEQAGKN